MLHAGDVIENPIMGQRIVLGMTPYDTGGAFTELEYTCKPFTGKGAAPAHFHPTFEERFEILAGEARYRLDRDERDAHPGDLLVFPAGIIHLHPWSISADELRVRQRTTATPPNLLLLAASGDSLVTLFGLARDGKVNKQGIPNILQLAVLVHSMMPGTYLAGLPVPAQQIVFGTLAALGKAAGYKARYIRYSGELTTAA